MARRQVQTIEQPAPILPEEIFTPDDNVTKLLIEQAGGAEDAVVKVYKCGGPQPGQRPGQGTIRDAWLYECAPQEFNEEQLQASYGAGKYRLRMYGTRPQDGNYGGIMNKVLEIGAPPAFRANGSTVTQAGAGGVNVNMPGSGGSDIAKAIAETLAPILQSQALMMQKMAEHLSGSKTEWLAELRAYKDILAPASAPSAPLDGLKTLLELSQSMHEDRIDDPDSAPYKLLGKGIDVFQKLIDKAQGGAPAAGNGEAAPAAAIAAPAQAAPVAASEEEMLKVLFNAQLQTFIEAAKEADDDYEFYATLLYKKAPDEFLEALKSETWFAQLCTMASEFAPYQAWCSEVRKLVIEMLKDEEAPASETLTVPAKETTMPADGPAKK